MVSDGEQARLVDNLIQELRRGVIPLAVLSQLQEEQYGYSIMKSLAEKGFQVDQGTLYPLLRRLESQGLLRSTWRIEDSRPRRYYVVSGEGRRVLAQLREEWARIQATVAPLIE